MNTTAQISDHNYDDPGGILAAGLTVVANKYPIPNVVDLTPDEAEKVLAQWRIDARAFWEDLRRRHREWVLHGERT